MTIPPLNMPSSSMLSLVVLFLHAVSAVSTNLTHVKFEVSNLEGESPDQRHTFYVEMHPEWVSNIFYCYDR